MEYGVTSEMVSQVKDLWVWQSKTRSVSLYKVADTWSIVKNRTNDVSRSWN
jgi:hypothetical protein